MHLRVGLIFSALKEIDEAPRFLKPDCSATELADLFAGHDPPRFRPEDAPPPSVASLQSDPWLQHDLARIPGIQRGERTGTAIEFGANRNVQRSNLDAPRAAGAASRRRPRVK